MIVDIVGCQYGGSVLVVWLSCGGDVVMWCYVGGSVVVVIVRYGLMSHGVI